MQLEWLVQVFRLLWPYANRPAGVTSGDDNPWDATQLLEWAVFQIAKDPSDRATRILRALRDAPDDGYTGTIQSAIATQRRSRLEANFTAPPLATYKAILCDSGQPQNAADVRENVSRETARRQRRRCLGEVVAPSRRPTSSGLRTVGNDRRCYRSKVCGRDRADRVCV